MGKLIAVGNLKGGTGKSTIAVNLACALRDADRTVVLVDADAQGTRDRLAGRRPAAGPGRERCRSAASATRSAGSPACSALKAGADHVVVDLPPQVGSGIASALLMADLLAGAGEPVGRRSAGDRPGPRSAAPRPRGARHSAKPACHAGAEPGRPAHRDRPARSRHARPLRAQGRAGRSASARPMSARSPRAPGSARSRRARPRTARSGC